MVSETCGREEDSDGGIGTCENRVEVRKTVISKETLGLRFV